jgi:purine-binding chemotaxis protein CheW
VINLRGAVVPVLDVRLRLGIEAREVTATTVVIVVRIPQHGKDPLVVGCVVDAVSDVATIDTAQIRPAPDACGTVESHYLDGVASVDDKLVLLLDVARLLEQPDGDAPMAATAGGHAPGTQAPP